MLATSSSANVPRIGQAGWVKSRKFHVDEATCRNATGIKDRLKALGGLIDSFLTTQNHVVITRQEFGSNSETTLAVGTRPDRPDSAKSLGCSSRARKLMAGASTNMEGERSEKTIMQDFLERHGSKITVFTPDQIDVLLKREESRVGFNKDVKPPPKKSKHGHFIEIGHGKDGRRDFGIIEPGVKPIWHLNVPAQGERAAWLEKEHKKDLANKCKKQEKHKDKKACGFCNIIYTDWEQHVESLPHRQKALAVENNETPEAQAFREFFGLPHNDFAEIHKAREARGRTATVTVK